MCAEAGTDKGPYVSQGHRHPYTAPYSLMFEPLRFKPIKFAEVGVYRGASMRVWRSFFTQARIYGYDRDPEYIKYIETLGMPASVLGVMDASSQASINEVFTKDTSDGELFDVIIDDASHDPADQETMIKSAMKFLKPGGMLIVEDIFRDHPENGFLEAIKNVLPLISFHTFIICDHVNRYSPGWNNDKMLVLVRSNLAMN
jgi:SAM-dependent methyltransferase